MSEVDKLEEELKAMIIECLALEDMSPQDISSDMILFGEGLGLDSVDALELGLELQKRYGVELKADDEDTKEYFRCVGNLAKFIASQKNNLK